MRKIGIIGVGKMGRAILQGLSSFYPKEYLLSCDLLEESRKFSESLGVRSFKEAKNLAERVDFLILAVKPKEALGVLGEISEKMDNSKVLLSIVAGLPTQKISQALGENGRILRAMPNLPLLIGEGAIGLCRGPRAEEEDLAFAKSLFSNLGEVVEVRESLMDAVTALSGSGPAYFALFIEAMIDGGVRMGLSREEALKLCVKTALGTAKMILQGVHPALLKEEVMSPGGTTAEGIYILELKGVRGAIMEALFKAMLKAMELSDEGKDLRR
jgi:pyrroline-5-carboxylate reductase